MTFIIGFIFALLAPMLALLGIDVSLTYGATGIGAVLGSLLAYAVATDIRIHRRVRAASLLPARQPMAPPRLPPRGHIDISLAARFAWTWPGGNTRRVPGLSGDVRLDVNTVIESAAPTGRLLPAPAPSSCIVLIGQDPRTQVLLTALLGDEGWRAVVCDEEDFFEFVERGDYDMVLLDLDGVPAGRRLIDLLILDPASSGVPIVACTSDPERLAATERDLGRYGVELLPKPFNADDLYGAIRTVVDAARGSGGEYGSWNLRRRTRHGLL